MKPTIGRIVRTYGVDGTERPAIITRVWTEDCVNLQVFEDYEIRPVTSAMYRPSPESGSYWWWPTLEPDVRLTGT